MSFAALAIWGMLSSRLRTCLPSIPVVAPIVGASGSSPFTSASVRSDVSETSADSPELLENREPANRTLKVCVWMPLTV